MAEADDSVEPGPGCTLPEFDDLEDRTRLNRLMTAQDKGSAIKDAQRADIYSGADDPAGRAPVRLDDPGRPVVSMPIQRPYALHPDPIR